MTITPSSLSWREPAWSFRPRYIAELLESGLFTLRFWLRAYAFSAAIALIAIAALYLSQPSFRLPPQIFATPLIVPLFIALKVGLLYLFPPTINVSAKRIHFSHGDGAFAIDRSKPLAAAINADNPDRPALTIRYATRRGREHTRTYGIPPRINLEELHNLLNQQSA